MSILNSDARGSPEQPGNRRRDLWVATGSDRRITLFRPGKLYCPNGHRVSETQKLLEGSGVRYCEKHTPVSAPRGERGHSGPCDTWIYIIAGLRAFDGEDATSIQVAVEVTPEEVRHMTSQNLGTLAAVEYLGMLAWTAR
jgi:hypothetical protein